MATPTVVRERQQDSAVDDRRALRELARSVAVRELAPAAARAEARDGHLTADELRAVVRAVSSAGLLTLLLPADVGGGGGGALDNVLVQEELGAVEAGLAAALNLTMAVPDLLGALGAPHRLAEIAAAPDGLLLAGALNEPSVAGSEGFDPAPTAASFLRTRAVQDGDAWVLTGSKAGWVTNAGAADVYLVFARTSFDDVPAQTTSAFWVPASTAGLSHGPRSELLGLRTGFHAELFLDDVRLASDALIGAPGAALPAMQMASGRMVTGLAAIFVGLARAALELALAHTSTRTSWGRPLREHQAVALRLADMDAAVRSARLVVHDAAAAVDAVLAGAGDPAQLGVLVPQCKARAVDAAIACASDAVRLLGATGVTRGGGAERLLRDAWTGYSCDFTGDLLRLAAAAALPTR